MAEIDLKAYTTHLKDLEHAIYTQNRLMPLQAELIQEQAPKPPVLKELEEPIKPKPVYDNAALIENDDIPVWIITIILLLAGIFGLYCSFHPNVGLVLGTVILLILGGLGVKLLLELLEKYKTSKNNIKHLKLLYDLNINKYPTLLEKYHQDVKEAEQIYQDEINDYYLKASKHDERYKEIMETHKSTLETLEKALKNNYDEDIIFPKYRNLVAITAINEYLMSGRCSQLEGPEGAYNLYEKELRQNIIISQLSSIIDNLEQIKSNQFSLYQELQKSNNTINEILSETKNINKTEKLTAYFSSVIALAETSPKFYYNI